MLQAPCGCLQQTQTLEPPLKNLAKRLYRSELVRGSFIALCIKVLAAGAAFAMNLVVARQLGAEQAGYFFLCFTSMMLVSGICRQGYDNALVRFIAAENSTQASTGLGQHARGRPQLPIHSVGVGNLSRSSNNHDRVGCKHLG